MITRYSRFASLGRQDRRLVLEAASLMTLAGIGLRFFRLRTIQRLLDRYVESYSTQTHSPPEPNAIDRVHWAVTAVARRVPKATCLVQALTADALLRRRQVACELRMGMRIRGNSAANIEAHAWVECNGVVVIGGIDTLSTFEPFTATRTP
jgi:hypothetical protein